MLPRCSIYNTHSFLFSNPQQNGTMWSKNNNLSLPGQELLDRAYSDALLHNWREQHVQSKPTQHRREGGRKERERERDVKATNTLLLQKNVLHCVHYTSGKKTMHA